MADSNRNNLDGKHASEYNHYKVNKSSPLRNTYSLTLGHSCYSIIKFNDTLTDSDDISPILDGISNESLLAITDLDNVLTGKGHLTDSDDISPILDGISNESLLAIADLDNVLTGKGNLTDSHDNSLTLDGISNESLLAIADLDNVLTGKGNIQESVNDTYTDGKGNAQESVNDTVAQKKNNEHMSVNDTVTYGINHSVNDDIELKSVNDMNSVNEYGMSTDQIFRNYFKDYNETIKNHDTNMENDEVIESVHENHDELYNIYCDDCNENTLVYDECIDPNDDLEELFDATIAYLNSTWVKPLYVKDAFLLLSSNLSDEQKKKVKQIHKDQIDVLKISDIDILRGVRTKQTVKPYIYFDHSKYPVTEIPFYDKETKTWNENWVRLKNHIQACALESGYSLYTNGGSRSAVTLPHREFRCSRGKKYKNQSQLFPTFREYRKINMINDRSRSRGPGGNGMIRKRGHFRPVSDTCTFNFTVCVDKKGYHIHNGRGRTTHRYHLKRTVDTTHVTGRHLPQNIKNTVNEMSDGFVSRGAMRNVIFRRTGKILSIPNIQYLCRKLKQDTGEHKSVLLDSLSSVDQMIDFFVEKKIDYYCLLHTNNINIDDVENGVLTETNVAQKIPNFIQHCKFSEQEEIKRYCNDHREEMLLTSAQHLMVAIAWVLPQEKRLFDLFPEVLFIDITSDSNKEKRPLFTVTGRTSSGSMFTLMRAFLPNEKTWIFRWLFSIVIPNSFKKSSIDRIQVMITDGDSQEYKQLDLAIAKYIPNALRVRCGYHLNKKTWERKGPRYTHYDSLTMQSNCSLQSRIISDWIYSWMKPSCETEFQYLASKYLLNEYLDRDDIIEDCGAEFIEGVRKMIRENIEPVEHNYVYYLRKTKRHYAEYSNSAHEGTNHGLKYSADGTNPRHLIDESSQRLTFQGERKYSHFISKTTKELQEFKSWNILPCAKHLNNRGASLLLQEKQNIDKYEVYRMDNTFYLRYRREERKIRDSPIPQWENVRVLRIPNDYITCSCCMFPRDGLVCRHIFALFDIIKHDINHHDIDIVWWLSYAVYAYSMDDDFNEDDCAGKLRFILELMNGKKKKGPKCQLQMFESIPKHTSLPPDWILNNDTEAFCLSRDVKITYDDIRDTIHMPFGLSSMSQTLSQESINESETTNNRWQFNSIAEYNALCNPAKRKQPFFFLRDTYLRTCDTLQALPEEYTVKFEKEFSDLHMKYKGIAFQQSGGVSKGKIVSSCIPDSKKRKTHGVKKLKKKK